MVCLTQLPVLTSSVIVLGAVGFLRLSVSSTKTSSVRQKAHADDEVFQINPPPEQAL